MSFGRDKSTYTADEVIAVLQRTYLPTIITEGKDDYFVFRRLEGYFSPLQVSLLPVGSKGCALSVFDRREELPKNLRVAFIVDKDNWVFVGVPEQYKDDSLITTDGYSIENDLFVDGNLCSLMHADEFRSFSGDIAEYMKWYSFAASQIMRGTDCKLDHPIDLIVPRGRSLNAEFQASVGMDSYPEDLYASFMGEYERVLRGKSLILLLLRYLNAKGRPATYRRAALLEIGAARSGDRMNSIREQIATLLQTS